MKKIIFIVLFGLCTNYVFGQEESSDSTVDLNVLNAPANPAFNLMGISPSSIDKPSDLNAFRLSLQNATNNFTKLPSNYAVEIAPGLLFRKKSQTLQQFNSVKFGDVFWQSLSLSIGMAQATDNDGGDSEDTVSFTKIGVGVKFSIIRPKWKSGPIDTFYSLLRKTHDEYSKMAEKQIDGNPRLKSINIEMVKAAESNNIQKIHELDLLRKSIRDSIINTFENQEKSDNLKYMDNYKKAAQEFKKYAQGLKIERVGAFLDFATGVALDFPDNKFNNSLVSKAGAWLTGGYENGNKGLSVLGITRYLFQPDKIFADSTGKIATTNISTFDAGAKVSLTAFKGKFNVSTEAIYRSVLNHNVIKPSWRLTFNAEYDLGIKNQKITLAIGRNFDGTVTKDGTLIAAINFVKGFGTVKSKL
jgi:hypothetical protein